MKCIFFEIGETEEASLRTEIAKHPELRGFRMIFSPNKLTADTANSAIDAEFVSVFIDSVVDRKIIDSLKNAKLLTTRSTGFDHIDRAYAKEKGISVANAPAYGSRTVAEFTFALLLGLSRKIFEASYKIKSGEKFEVKGMRGVDLYGKTIGVVGTGRIGQNVAAIAKGFGMEVLAFDAFPNKEAASKIGFAYVPLDELLSISDVVSLHVPALPETAHLINRQSILKFKKGALLINTARGEICENEALLEGLEKGILGGIGLDVIDGERAIKSGSASAAAANAFHKLNAHPNAFITPHMAFYTAEAQAEISRVTIENICAVLNGKPQNVIT